MLNSLKNMHLKKKGKFFTKQSHKKNKNVRAIAEGQRKDPRNFEMAPCYEIS